MNNKLVGWIEVVIGGIFVIDSFFGLFDAQDSFFYNLGAESRWLMVGLLAILVGITTLSNKK